VRPRRPGSSEKRPDAAALASWLPEAVARLTASNGQPVRAILSGRQGGPGRSELLLERLGSGDVSAAIPGNGEGDRAVGSLDVKALGDG